MFGENELQSFNMLFISFILVIIYFVWKSTEVRREIQPIESIQHTFEVRRSSSIISNASTTSTVEENLTNSVEELAHNIFAEASESYNNSNSNNSLIGRRTNTEDDIDGIDGISDDDEENELTEEERIIREMDRDLPQPQQQQQNDVVTTDNSESADIMLRNRIHTARDNNNEASTSNDTNNIHTNSTTSKEDDKGKISIKLKYLNDEIKTVECFLNESVGNFKRRNFKKELESKLIKLIFNGKLLEDDSKLIKQCGIFSDATVHCLIVQKRSNMNAVAANQNNGNSSRNGSNDGNNNNNNSLINYFNIVGILLVTLTLICCWYCRVQYESYFSIYSTIVLIIMTSLFIIPLCSMVFS